MADRDRHDVRAQADDAGPTQRKRPFRWLTGPRKRMRIALLATLAILLPLVPLTLLAANPFTDLNNGSVHNADIDTAYNLGIVNGVSATEYDPNSPVTREQMASFLARTAALNRIAFTSFPSAGADADLGAGPSKDYMAVSLEVPGRAGQPVYVRVSFTGYAFAKSATAYVQNPGCTPACMLSGKLRVDGGAPQVVTRSVVGGNPNDYVGQAGPPAVATADRKDFSGSAVFLVEPGTHTFTMSVTREIGTATNVGFAFGNMQAETIPFGSSGALSPMALTSTLNGANEVDSNGNPNDQGDPDGTGTAMVSLNTETGELCYSITVANIDSATAAHIHRGAAGVAGPVVVGLTPPAGGSVSGCTGISTALAEEIAEDPSDFYVNVHNGPFPDGAVRGQLGN